MYEVFPANHPRAGKHTDAWPFPDINTGVNPQGTPPLRWGMASARDAQENSVTFRLRYGSFFISVYAATDVEYTLRAFLHNGDTIAMQNAHSGPAKERRMSMQAAWLAGQLTVSVFARSTSLRAHSLTPTFRGSSSPTL